jgi:hypothetical protein
MTATINDRNPMGATPAESGRAHETQKPNRNQGVRTGTAATGNIGGRVEPSSTLGALSRAMSAFGSERANRVQALAAQYRSGGYCPDSAATAHGMVTEALLVQLPCQPGPVARCPQRGVHRARQPGAGSAPRANLPARLEGRGHASPQSAHLGRRAERLAINRTGAAQTGWPSS